ncbi:phosphatidylinositol transfer protein [Poronia punctata]|nr:phosphatidylinositol transfer protein [Poronia punctata]
MKAASVKNADINAGYLGNLTTEEENTLRQLWSRLLEAFEFTRDDGNEQEQQQQHDKQTISQASSGPVGSVKRTMTAKSSSTLNGGGSLTMTANELREAWLGMVKNEDPDSLLLRFLRARKWDVTAAFNMLKSALIWRVKEVNVDRLMLEGEPWCLAREKNKDGGEEEAHEYLEQLRCGKVYMRGEDRQGRPVGYVHVALHKPGQQSQETIEKLVVQTIEMARCLFTPPNESFCVVFDMTNFSLSNMDWQPVRFIIRAFEANYPECLGRMLIHNAPWIFSGIWKIIRGLLDPVVAAKVDFTRNAQDLERHIAKENIISRVGGQDNWTYEYIEPSEDEDKLLADTDTREKIMNDRREIAGRFLAATQDWIRHLDAQESEEAAIQKKLRDNCIESLAANYWRLDPYVRSRNLIDRWGILKPDGKVDPYPDRNTASNAVEETKVRDGDVGTGTGTGTGTRGDTGVAVHQEVVAAAG